jgi:hypothetical protein
VNEKCMKLGLESHIFAKEKKPPRYLKYIEETGGADGG